MKAVAHSGTALLPAPPRSFSRLWPAMERQTRFTPGIQVKILLETGGEEGVLLRWSE